MEMEVRERFFLVNIAPLHSVSSLCSGDTETWWNGRVKAYSKFCVHSTKTVTHPVFWHDRSF